MFEGTFRLLKMEAKLILALVKLGFSIATATTRGLTWLVRKMLRREAVMQAPAPVSEKVIPTAVGPATAAAAPSPHPAAPAPVTVNVTINNGGATPAPPHTTTAATPDTVPPPRPTTATSSAAALAQRSAALVLAHPDHGIYLTTGSTFMVPHPFADGLLEQLDYMLYQGAHRNGRPWAVPPALDTSGQARHTAPLTNLILPDDGMDDVPSKPLPHDPEGIWIARLGQPFERQRPHHLREEALRRRRPVPEPAPAPVLAGVWPDGIDICRVRPLPSSDGEIWVARAAKPVARP